MGKIANVGETPPSTAAIVKLEKNGLSWFVPPIIVPAAMVPYIVARAIYLAYS
jgi:hypothetical protein